MKLMQRELSSLIRILKFMYVYFHMGINGLGGLPMYIYVYIKTTYEDRKRHWWWRVGRSGSAAVVGTGGRVAPGGSGCGTAAQITRRRP